ncbi:hypothetical protein ACJ41O_006454 [Fusarium nematophilum]
MRSQLPTLSPEPTMASGLAAGAATPHRSNAAYQVLIDSGPPTTLETPTPSQPAKRKRNHELKDIAKEITGYFSTYLTATFLADPKARPDYAEPYLIDGRAVPANWATVARSGHTQPQPRVNQQPQTNPAKGPAKAQPAEDLRILVRVPEEHQEWAKSLTNYALREATCKTLGLSLADIPDIHHTATGFAIRPRNKAIRQKILAKEQEVGRHLKATKIELPTKWYNYVVPNCPTKLTNIFGEVVDISTVIHDEVAAQTNLRPTSIRPSRHGPNPATDKGSWIVSFLKKVPPFRLFGTSAYSRLIEKKRPIPTRHNPGCQGYHSSQRCANCFGPAPAGHSDYPAKPSRKNGKLKLPTAKELAAIRRAGQRLFANSQNRANNAGVENTNRTSKTTAPLADDTAEDETPRASTVSLDQRASKRRAQPHNDPGNTGDRHNSAMDINSITLGANPNNPFDLLSQQPGSSQRPRRSATKTNYNYDSQFQYLEDNQLSDRN